jgi:hypothetical protein
MKKIVIVVLIFTLGCYLTNKYYIKNIWCKTKDNRYEVWSSTPNDITENIRKGECECISESLIIEKKPNPLSNIQLYEIKKELPNWSIKNIKEFTIQDKQVLISELSNLSDKEFSEKLIYKYTFLEKFTGCFVPVYIYKINSTVVYCPNYTKAYELYDGKYAPKHENVEPFGKKPNYPIIESKSW